MADYNPSLDVVKMDVYDDVSDLFIQVASYNGGPDKVRFRRRTGKAANGYPQSSIGVDEIDMMIALLQLVKDNLT